jgi:hypothetical protein
MNESNFFEYTQLIEEKKSQNPQISAWQNDLLRLIRRNDIHRQLDSGLPLNEIRTVVREHEKKLGISELVDGLVTQEFVVSPKVAALAEDLADKLSEFKFLDCVVLQGSAVNGGGAIRNAISGVDSHDLDWGIIYEGNQGPSDYEIKKLMIKANRVIPSLAKKHGLGSDFRSCRGEKAVNPGEGVYMPKIIDLEHAKYMWKHFIGGSATIKNLILYFQPSFPKVSNTENRKLLLEALSTFSEDTSLFNKVIDKFINGWDDYHIIKEKHLGDSVRNSPKGIALGKRVVDQSGFIMRSAMEVLLRATASGKIYAEHTAYSP